MNDSTKNRIVTIANDILFTKINGYDVIDTILGLFWGLMFLLTIWDRSPVDWVGYALACLLVSGKFLYGTYEDKKTADEIRDLKFQISILKEETQS